ncbi:MAG TPA: rhodanese-like domain-containing protein [Anaerolineae bacterium]|nr:rhodanese-like domain-containing protein [Anaerolineae bacterium]
MNRWKLWLPCLLVLTSLLLGACSTAVATQAETVERTLDAAYTIFLDDMVMYNTIGLEDLISMLTEEPPPFLLDVRDLSEIGDTGYIEGAVVIPLRELGRHMDLLPSFDTTIVSYCGSGWRCAIAMTALEALGWENALSLRDGSFSGWVHAGYPFATGLPDAVPLNVASPDPAMLTLIDETLSNIPEDWGMITVDTANKELIMNPDLILIDVRRAEEVQKTGIITGALNIPLEEFIARKTEWPADKATKIVIYCSGGHRSTIAMTILWSYGYRDVRSLIS